MCCGIGLAGHGIGTVGSDGVHVACLYIASCMTR